MKVDTVEYKGTNMSQFDDTSSRITSLQEQAEYDTMQAREKREKREQEEEEERKREEASCEGRKT